MNAWVLLAIAGALEIVWALGMKYSNGFTRPLASAVTLVGIVASILLLERAVRELPVGTAYAVWSGIGAMGTAILAVVLLGEPLTLLRVAGVLMIVGGIAALKLA